MTATIATDDARTDLTKALSKRIEASGPLKALGARLDEAEAGYVEISAPAAGAGEGGQLSAGAVATLAEAAARFALGAEGETAELSLHLHGLGPLQGAERLIARGEALREARADRPLAAAQADVFKADASGGEALLATALVSVLSPR